MNFNDMLKKKNKGNSETPENVADAANDNGQVDGQEQAPATDKVADGPSAEEKLNEELKQANDKYLRLYAEFDNFRRRTIKEREDARKTEGKDIIVALLPVLDDFERALRSMENVTDV